MQLTKKLDSVLSFEIFLKTTKLDKLWLTIFLCFLFAISSNAQRNSISPYSAFGIGDIVITSDPTTLSMGGTNVSFQNPDNNQFNFINPAANSDLDFTSFEIKVNNDYSIFEEGSKKSSDGITYISGLNLGIPINNKTKIGLALQPYSAVGYDVSLESINPASETQTNSFSGKGTLNDFEFALSRQIAEGFTLGGSISYLFGKIEQSQEIQVENVELISLYKDDINLSGARFSFGMHYTKPIKKDKYFSVASRLSTGTNITSETNSLVSTFSRLDNTELTYNIDTLSYQSSTSQKKFPLAISFGGEIGEKESWRLAAQFDFQEMNDFAFSNNTNTRPLADNTNSYGLAIGGYWVPNKNSYNNYFERVSYRSGMYYRNLPIEIGGGTIDNYGLTFGLGLPMGKDNQGKSKINLSLDMGQIKHSSDEFLKESYINLGVGLIFSSKWFVKKKIE